MGQHSTFFHGHEREEWQMVQKSLAGHRLYLWYWMPCSPISISSFQKQWVQRLVAKTKQETLNLSREVRWLLQTGNGPFHLSQPHSSQDTKVSELPSKPDSSQKKGKDKQSKTPELTDLLTTMMCVCVCVCARVCACSVMSNPATPWAVTHQTPLSWDFPGKNTGVGCHFLLQGIFPNNSDTNLEIN